MPDLVLLPGFMCDADLWSDMRSELAALGRAQFGNVYEDDTLEGMARRVLDAAPAARPLRGDRGLRAHGADGAPGRARRDCRRLDSPRSAIATMKSYGIHTSFSAISSFRRRLNHHLTLRACDFIPFFDFLPL